MSKMIRDFQERLKADKRTALNGYKLNYHLTEAEISFNKKVGKK